MTPDHDMPIQAPKMGFGGLWTHKCDYSSSRPPKGTSLRKSASFKLSTVKIRWGVWPVGELTESVTDTQTQTDTHTGKFILCPCIALDRQQRTKFAGFRAWARPHYVASALVMCYANASQQSASNVFIQDVRTCSNTCVALRVGAVGAVAAWVATRPEACRLSQLQGCGFESAPLTSIA